MDSLRGLLTPTRVLNGRTLDLAQERTGVGIPAYDAIDVALRERVPEVYFSRVVGPTPVAASVNIDGTAGGSPYALTFTANEVGEWANGAAGGLMLEITSPGGG